ncbi:MAG: hypothetical protein II854_05725 [Prevotella sp.]|nr:hypothetical protein [Prevotella sp.]
MMRRLLTSFIALAAMLMGSLEAEAWTSVAFRSTLDDNWTASTSGGKIMTKVNDNEFYIDITTNGDVSFRFYVSDGQEWLIPNNGNGTVATHNTDVWGNSGNSSTNDCFKLVPGTYNSFRIYLYYKNQGGDGKHYWTVKAVPNGSGGGGTSDEAYYLVSPDINNGQKCEFLKFYPSRNRTKDGYDGKTDYRYWTLNFKYDDIKKIDPTAPETFNYYIVDKDGNAVCRPYANGYQLGKASPSYKYCDDTSTSGNNQVTYQTYDDTKTNAGGNNTFQMSTAWGKSFTLFLDKDGNRPLTMNINKSFTEDASKKYYLIGNLFKGTADAGAAWSPTDPQMRMLMERHEYADSVVYTATVKRPANGWANVYMDICPYYLIEDNDFSDWDWQHIIRPQVDPVIINNIGSKDGVAPHGGLAIPGSGDWKYDYSSLNPPIDNDVESFIFSMNITTATYRIDYVHDFYIVGEAVQDGDDASTYWAGAKAKKMDYDANLGCWQTEVNMSQRGFFRFANDMKMSSSFGENDAKPMEPDNVQAGVVYDNLNEAETQYVNKVNYYSESSAAHDDDMQQRDIQFWLPSGTYTIKFYAQAENNGTAVANDFARTYYVIEPKFTFHAPVDLNNENLTQFTHFKAFSSAHTMNKPEGVTMYTAAVKEGTDGKIVTLTELTSTNNLIPANTGVLLATSMPGATGAAQEIDFTTATNPWEAIPFDQSNDLVPHLTKGTIGSASETGYNYIFGYRTLNTTPSGKVTLGFFKPTGSNLPANSAYLQSGYNVTTDAQGFAIFFDEDNTTTAIESVESAATADDNAPYYSLQGVRYAGKPAAGIYIHNGKKVIIK